MKEELSAGRKQFFYVLLGSLALYIVLGMILNPLSGQSFAFIGGIVEVLAFGVYGYSVLIHYTARFTYTLKDGRLRINRMIGKRNKEIEFACLDITRTKFGAKPEGYAKPMQMMRRSVFDKKQSLYIEYKIEDKLSSVVIEPSDKLMRRIEKERKNIDG